MPPPTIKPRKPWITERTLSLLEVEARLVAHGHWRELADQSKAIKRSAELDRVAWVERSMTGSQWAPVRALTKPRRPRALRLESSEHAE
eukprot:15461236-Alexandrium_andersonii.AAC.1